MSVEPRIAIVGLGGLFPGSPTLEKFWKNIVTGVDCSRDVPAGRWLLDPHDVISPGGPFPDRVPHSRGYYLDDIPVDCEGLDIDEAWLRRLDPVFHLILYVGQQAFRSASFSQVDRRRVGVILGHIALPTEKVSALSRQYLGRALFEKLALDSAAPANVEPLNRYVAGLPAGVLAKALGLGGGTFTLDAACASSLYALKLAADELRAGRADAMFTGGAARPDCLYTQMGFAQLRALSPTGRCSPFDAAGDGLMVGEGCGIFVLKRLDDALRHGDTIHAVLAGEGVSNDVEGNLLAPASEGQLRALRAAYAAAGWRPSAVDVIECHATGTPVGDAVEFRSLRSLWRDEPHRNGQCVIGSVKSAVGHLLTGAGSAGLMKLLLAMRQETLPPTANFRAASPQLEMEQSPFRVLAAAAPWPKRDRETPRRAAISGFGFGGINAHVLVEEFLQPATFREPHAEPIEIISDPPAIAIVGIDARFGPWQTLRELERRFFDAADDLEPKSKSNDWGIGDANLRGFFIESLSVPLDQFRIPPKELEEMLPQQLLALQVAAGALADAPGWERHRQRTGVFLGLGLDLNTTNFHFRWSIHDAARQWQRAQAGTVDDAEFNSWTATLREDAHPALTANRVMGALGSIAASRIARAFQFGGPSFTICSEDASAGSALEVAIRRLQRNDIDQALVGGIDLAGDARTLLATAAHRSFPLTGEGAAVVVLKRLEDAERDGDRVYAVLRGMGVSNDGRPTEAAPTTEAYLQSLRQALADSRWNAESIQYFEAHGSGLPAEDAAEANALTEFLPARTDPPILGSTQSLIGHAGAASFLAGIVRTALALHHDLLPPSGAVNLKSLAVHFPKTCVPLNAPSPPALRGRGEGVRRICNPATTKIPPLPHPSPPAKPGGEGAKNTAPYFGVDERLERFRVLREAEFWQTNRDQGPRRAAVAGMSIDGNCVHALLQEHEPSKRRTQTRSTSSLRQQPEAVFFDRVDPANAPAGKYMTVIVGGKPIRVSPPPAIRQLASIHDAVDTVSTESVEPPVMPDGNLTEIIVAAGAATASAHADFLRFADAGTKHLSCLLSLQSQWLSAALAPAREPVEPSFVVQAPISVRENPLFDRNACQKIATGSLANVLGPEFAPVDSHPTRVRLPDGPLLLCDRVMEIEGEPRSLSSGRIVTEHDVSPGRWYVAEGHIPPSIAIEAGQADLFLSGYLGIDFVTKGLAVYRLLDAKVTFHRPLLEPGTTIRYDIRIDRFFRQGDTHLFRFRFEGSVNGEPLLTMTDGCAGFFTADELASGRGVVKTELDRRPLPGKKPADWREPMPIAGIEKYSAEQLDALRAGDLATCFGHAFRDLPVARPLTLPGGMLKLVDRVVELDPRGGRFGLGRIRAELDIHPDDWFLTCHFVDDQVMPGTLMYECCLHTLRIFLLRLGWVGERDRVRFEPVPGVASQLKCRGQVTGATKTVMYEVAIKEIGYRPEPYVIADALMYTDGKPIVDIANMCLLMTGTNRDEIEPIGGRRGVSPTCATPDQLVALTPRRSPIFDRSSVLEFATGKPSVAFGSQYRPFDQDRFIARLPAPPYSFLDRIVEIRNCEPWKMTAGGEIVAEYDVPTDAWYFAANRQPTMPFAVLLEVALQSCGWNAAFVGSALASDTDLHFRNLGGKATQFLPVRPDSGTLKTCVGFTKVSKSAGMIIQNYRFNVTCDGATVYEGDTYFGFFSKSALADQVGIRDAATYQPGEHELAQGRAFEFPRSGSFPAEQLRMLDRIDLYRPLGGAAGIGFVRGSKFVNPVEWFFKAHFYQDPVWPGSLGLEAFLQLLKVVAAERWGEPNHTGQTVALGVPHSWSYRGQVVPTNRGVEVEATITGIDDTKRIICADGLLGVDGRVIYAMKDFSLQG